MITEFIKGHWYRYLGKNHCPGWNDSMDYVLDGKPHLCIWGKEEYAIFEDDKATPRGRLRMKEDVGWNWVNSLKNFICLGTSKFPNWKKILERSK